MFNRRDYDELEKRGLTAADIMKALDEKEAVEKKLKEQEDALNTTKQTLATMEGSFSENKRKLEELEASSRRTTPTTQVTQTEDQRPQFSFPEDEAAVRDRISSSLQPLAAATIMAGKNAAKLEAKLSLQGQTIKTPGGVIPLDKLWVRWLPEIDKAAAEVNPQSNLMLSATWINIFDYIKGKHFSEILEKPDGFIESVQLSTPGSVGHSDANNDKLNDEEMATVNKMKSETSGRMTPEKYAEIKKKIKFVNV